MCPVSLLLLGFASTTALLRAVPPPAPAIADLTRRSDVVAIVTVTNVLDYVSTEVASKERRRQSAVAVVDRPLKGTALPTLRLRFDPLNLYCRPPSLSTGQFLVFLQRQGDDYVRTDPWFGQAAIATNHVKYWPGRPVRLNTFLTEIQSPQPQSTRALPTNSLAFHLKSLGRTPTQTEREVIEAILPLMQLHQVRTDYPLTSIRWEEKAKEWVLLFDSGHPDGSFTVFVSGKDAKRFNVKWTPGKFRETYPYGR